MFLSPKENKMLLSREWGTDDGRQNLNKYYSVTFDFSSNAKMLLHDPESLGILNHADLLFYRTVLALFTKFRVPSISLRSVKETCN